MLKAEFKRRMMSARDGLYGSPRRSRVVCGWFDWIIATLRKLVFPVRRSPVMTIRGECVTASVNCFSSLWRL